MPSVKKFLDDLLERIRNGEQGSKGKLMLSMPLLPTQEEPVSRARAEWSKQLLSSEPFQIAIQFMNEAVVHEIVAADPLDTAKLQLLRLKLEIISEFPQVLQQFLDNYASIEAIKEEAERRNQESMREYR